MSKIFYCGSKHVLSLRSHYQKKNAILEIYFLAPTPFNSGDVNILFLSKNRFFDKNSISFKAIL